MNMRAEIREVMLAHGKPMRPAEVSAAMPDVETEKVTYSIMGMFNEGILSRVVREDGFSGYYASRNVQIKQYPTEEERLAAKRAADLRRNETLRKRRKAERAASGALAAHRARQAAARIAREAEREEAKRQRELDRERRRIQRAAERAMKPKPAPKPKAPKVRTLAQRIFATTNTMKAFDATVTPPPAKARPETVEEWMARTGKQPQRIPAAWEREQLAA